MSVPGEPVLCDDERVRRAALLGHPTLNGIDFLEVDATDPKLLHVWFLNELPAGGYGFPAHLERIKVEGGTRIVGVRVLEASREDDRLLDIRVDRVGDFSPYLLSLTAPELDPRFDRITFSFRPGCPVDLTPGPAGDADEPGAAPAIDYMAKDYASFRQLMLDLLPQLNPRFVERNPADLGIALVELLAYTGDRLSYFQDAVANEAFLETARRRISVRRHTRLVDYRMHDGANAQAVVQAIVREGAPGDHELPAGSKVVTRIVAPLRSAERPPGAVLDWDQVTAERLFTDPALAGAAVFETLRTVQCREENNEITIHAWGNEECRLPQGGSEAWLFSTPGGTIAVRPELHAGDLLLLEEARGIDTGIPGDADPAHRQVVELVEEPDETTDELFSDTLLDGELQIRGSGDDPLPLLHVRWRREDALAFPLWLSRDDPDRGLLRGLSVARGNLAPADHGLTGEETHVLAGPADERLRLRLDRGPLTIGRSASGDPAPAVVLQILFEGATDAETWRPVPDLLDSPPFAADFVAELGDDGRAVLRFGDGEYGRSIAGATEVTAAYRVGNGSAGNVGAEALSHLALPPASDTSWIDAARNPLPATGGLEPESLEEARERAPQAFRAKQLRAVTVEDWASAAREAPGVQGAVARFRWTGSWYAVVVGVDPLSSDDLVTTPDGRIGLEPGFEERVRAHLTRFRLAGYDLELRPPTFVPLELELEICVAPGHFRPDVAQAVVEELSARALSGGRRGFFHPDRFTFGQAVYLSRIYAAVEAVEGVDTALVRVFRRYGGEDDHELATGVLPLAEAEIAQLENDPSFVEHGVLRVVAQGGKA